MSARAGRSRTMLTIAERILREIRTRLRFMADVGLNYLSLDRASMTLSGGIPFRIILCCVSSVII